MSDKNHSRHFGGKGYTVALLLCAAAIGIGGYAYYSSTAGADPAQQVNMSDKNHSRHFGGKGYTVALLLCAAAIGIGGYAYYSSTAGADPAQQVNAPVAVTEPQRQTRPASTAPTGGTTQTTPATAPTTGKLHTCTPVEGEILAEYAMECLSYNQTTRDWRVHNGVDLAAS